MEMGMGGVDVRNSVTCPADTRDSMPIEFI